MKELLYGDCLDILPTIADESIDAVITDPPYGLSHHTGKSGWDNVINFSKLWLELARITKPKAAIVLFANQPFTTDLINSNRKLFKYQWIWIKSKPTGFINAQNAPLRVYEDICVFSKGTTANKSSNRMNYYPQGLVELNKFKKSKNDANDVWGARPSRANDGYVQKFTNYPQNILEYPSVTKAIHPTEKPQALLEYLIKTYTLEGETVLDFAAGSLSTCLAAYNTNRNYIGIEKNEQFFKLGQQRLNAVIDSNKIS